QRNVLRSGRLALCARLGFIVGEEPEVISAIIAAVRGNQGTDCQGIKPLDWRQLVKPRIRIKPQLSIDLINAGLTVQQFTTGASRKFKTKKEAAETTSWIDRYMYLIVDVGSTSTILTNNAEAGSGPAIGLVHFTEILLLDHQQAILQ